MLTLSEKLLLIALNDDKGHVVFSASTAASLVSSVSASCVFSASANFEFAIANCLLNLASAAFTKANLSLTVKVVALSETPSSKMPNF